MRIQLKVNILIFPQEKKTKQVVMSKIGPNESFAETSILKEEPMTCSIITATDVTLGTISAVNLYGLDQTTLDLLVQSCQPNSENLSKVCYGTITVHSS